MECVVPAILCSAFMDVAVAPEVGIDSLSSLVNFKKEGGGGATFEESHHEGGLVDRKLN